MNTNNQRLAIAEITGWKRVGMFAGYQDLMGEIPPCRGWIRVPDWTLDLNAAVSLCDHAAQDGIRCELNNGLDETWECVFKNEAHTRSAYGAGDTLAEAICESFLRLYGKWDEIPE